MPVYRIIAFLVVILVMTVGVHAYLWHRLVGSTHWHERLARAGRWFFGALGIVLVLAMPLIRLLPSSVAMMTAWVAYVWMGVVFLLLCVLIALEPFQLIAYLMERSRRGDRHTPRDVSRRRFIGSGVAITAVASATGGSIVGVANARAPSRTSHIGVPMRNVREGLRGLRIVHLTDIHVGPTVGYTYVRDVVTRTNALSPDIIVITGDLVDDAVDHLRDAVDPLRELRAAHGVYFVTGNHEYYAGATAWMAYLPELGIRVLRNEHVTIERNGERLHIVGIDDYTAHQFTDGHGADIDAAVAGCDPDVPTILLAHQPVQVSEAARAGIDLQLSGHTHGGQIRPFDFLVPLAQPYVHGLHKHTERTWIYVSRGTGYWGPPMRLGAPSEIAVVEFLAEHEPPFERDYGAA